MRHLGRVRAATEHAGVRCIILSAVQISLSLSLSLSLSRFYLPCDTISIVCGTCDETQIAIVDARRNASYTVAE
jgi:hypothetical protein